MCIISVKPAGTTLPSSKTFATMWANNPHGAGYMWAQDGRVHIRKGFMDYDAFMADLCHTMRKVDATEVPMIFHFRIATHGGIAPSRCHPFPLSPRVKDLEALKITTDVGIAHNGIIDIDPEDELSDTMEYIRSELTVIHGCEHGFSQRALSMIRGDIGYSRLAILTGEGRVYLIGHFCKDGQIFYSNGGFEPLHMTPRNVKMH